ncbi:MAG: DUF2793 domain-containing protein [Beijerinckiaceae bacterium]
MFTTNLSFPYLAAGQAQKHVTLNESLRRLDALVQLSVVSRGVSAPPATPLEGQRYLVPAGASGVWNGWSDCVAAFVDGGWEKFSPRQGWLAYVADEARLLTFDGNQWRAPAVEMQNLPQLGINASADSTNRLAVSAPATLFNHEGSGHQIKLNKASAGDTASLLFQTGYSGRAELGTCGTDAFSVKVSPDGASWLSALVVTPAGHIGIGTSTPAAPLEIERANAQITIIKAGASNGAGIVCQQKELPDSTAQRLGFLVFGSRGGGASTLNTGCIAGIAETAWTLNSSHPTALRFETTAAGQTNRSERMRLTGDGRLGIGVSEPTCALQVDGAMRPASYSVAGLPSAAAAGSGAMVFVSNEVGGAVMAFSDGTQWRRVTDRAVVS